MKRMTALVLVLVAASTVRADTITTFENFNLPLNSFLNNAGAAGGFTANGNFFNNNYDASFGAWYGWSISNTTNTTTPGFTNQYSAITGSGANGSATYAVAFTFGPNADPFHPASSYINLAPGTAPISIQVTNTTYAYLSMLNGGQFTKKFGAGDFLLLDVKGYTGLGGTGTVTGEKDLYLANLIGSNNYILNTWQTMDLTTLAGAESLVFGLRSSDNDPVFGINTPAYVAVDDLRTHVTATPEPSALVLMMCGLVVVVGFVCSKRRTAGIGTV